METEHEQKIPTPEEVKQMESEAALRLIWAMVIQQGGTVKIRDTTMRMITDDQELSFSYDPIMRETIVRTNITPSSIVPDKDGCQDEQSQKFDTDQSHT